MAGDRVRLGNGALWRHHLCHNLSNPEVLYGTPTQDRKRPKPKAVISFSDRRGARDVFYQQSGGRYHEQPSDRCNDQLNLENIAFELLARHRDN